MKRIHKGTAKYFSDIQGRYSAQCRLDWVQATASVETANVGRFSSSNGARPLAGGGNAMQEKRKVAKNLPSQLRRVYVILFTYTLYEGVGLNRGSKANIKTLKPSWLRKMKKKKFRAGRWPFIGSSGAAASSEKKECPLGKKKRKKKKQMAGN